MGAGSFDPGAYRAFTSSVSGTPTDKIYSRSFNKNLDPKGINRESRDSIDSPQSTPIIVGIDVTGSMGMISDVIARQGLGTLFTSILDRKPISDPHVMFMAIGDAYYDQFPLQVSQFEADNRIVEQLTQIYLEKGGGGNGFESYNLPWHFAARHTITDSYQKRAKRGYLFTIGDEEAPGPLTKEQIKRLIGDDVESDIPASASLDEVRKFYDVFHIVIKEGSHCRYSPDKVMSTWTNLLGQRVIPLEDHTKLAETIVSAIEVAEGVSAAVSAAKWANSAVGNVVFDAVRNIAPAKSPKRLASLPPVTNAFLLGGK